MSPDRKASRTIGFTVLIDIASILTGFLAAYHFRFMAGLIPLRGMAPGYANYAHILFIIVPVYLWFFRAYGLYQSQRHIRRIEEIFLVIKAISFAVIVLMALTFFYRGLSYSRVYLVSLWIFSIFTVSFSRYFLIQWEYWVKTRNKEFIKVLVVGMNANARHIITWARHNPHYGQKVIGVLGSQSDGVGKHLEEIPILGTTQDCEKMIEQLKPERVVLVDETFSRDRITDLVASCEDHMIDFKVAADIYGLMTRSVDVEYISRVPLLGFRSLPLDDPGNRFAKRLFDLIGTLLLFVLTSPLWLLAFILIILDDRGPFFYFQERIGRDGQVFKVIKFRTMRVDAEKESGPVWAKQNDDRRTRVGEFLRKTNIDELPQLWNVLAGHMSLVGPRPERPHFVEKFRDQVPRYMARHKVKSGITGWAQVHGYRGNTSIVERINHDLYYMENWSILLDVEILFMTLFAYKNAY